MKTRKIAFLFGLFILSSCSARLEAPPKLFPVWEAEGKASYYNNGLHGRKTASGEPYDKNALTAAHRSLPFGTIVSIWRTDIPNSDTIQVRINDRGPHVKSRLIDLSYEAAKQLDMINKGVATVHLAQFTVQLPATAATDTLVFKQ